MQYISIISQTLKPEYWSVEHEEYYTHHCHRGSAFESDWDCGNCDGACCEGCRKVEEDALKFSCDSDTLIAMAIAMGVPQDIAKDWVYDDFYSASRTGYHINWPEEWELEKEFPEFYASLIDA